MTPLVPQRFFAYTIVDTVKQPPEPVAVAMSRKVARGWIMAARDMQKDVTFLRIRRTKCTIFER